MPLDNGFEVDYFWRKPAADWSLIPLSYKAIKWHCGGGIPPKVTHVNLWTCDISAPEKLTKNTCLTHFHGEIILQSNNKLTIFTYFAVLKTYFLV